MKFNDVLDDLIANPPGGKPLNWLTVAIYRLGGPEQAAEKLGVRRQTVYVWLKRGNPGVRGLPYRDVERLAKLSRVRIELLGSVGSENEPDGKHTKSEH
jgi:hypothetical protein